MSINYCKDVERRRILGLLRDFDKWLSQEIHNSTTQRLAASNVGEPSDRYLFCGNALEEVRTELAALIAEVDEPEVVPLPAAGTLPEPWESMGSKRPPFEDIGRHLTELGFREQPWQRDFIRGEQRVNAIDLSFKLPATYTIDDLRRIVDPSEPSPSS